MCPVPYPPHLCCLATLEQRLPTLARFARSAPALNGCIAFPFDFVQGQGMQAIQHPTPRLRQCLPPKGYDRYRRSSPAVFFHCVKSWLLINRRKGL